jgi:hypothetical protein
VGSDNKKRLDLFETGFRELEKDLAALDDTTKAGGIMPAASDAELFKNPKSLGFAPNKPDPNGGGYYRYEKERAQAWARTWAILFGADKVRVGTHQITWSQSFLDLDNITGQKGTNPHDVMHNSINAGNGDPVPVLNWHVASLSTLASMLKDIPEASGESVLDNTVLILLFDGGFGPDRDLDQFAPGYPGSHSTQNMVALVAGGLGGIAQGVHVKAPNGTQPAQLLLNAMRAAGYTGNTIGKLSHIEIRGFRKA